MNPDDSADATGTSDPVRPAEVGEDALMRVFRVPPEMAGRRVDVFLPTQLRNTSRTRARVIIENSAYHPDGRRLRASDRLRAEDRVVLWRPPLDESDEPVSIPVLYEDEHLLVVDKPPLMAVHPTARHHRNTVLMLLMQERPDAFLTLIHRLDRETSGILMLAKSREADRRFKVMLERRTQQLTGVAARHRGIDIQKTYLALTWGIPQDGVIDAPLEQDPDNPLRVKMRLADAERGAPARTAVSVVERRGDYAQVRCKPLTGRQHQIRVHLASVGCPVVGDKLYGPDDRLLARAADNELTEDDLLELELPRQALHAASYELNHAITGERLMLRSQLAPDLAAFWNSKR